MGGVVIVTRAAEPLRSSHRRRGAGHRGSASGLITGRVFVVFTRDSTREPRHQVSDRRPVLRPDVRGLAASQSVVVSDAAPSLAGYPRWTSRRASTTQAFFNVCTTIARTTAQLHHGRRGPEPVALAGERVQRGAAPAG